MAVLYLTKYMIFIFFGNNELIVMNSHDSGQNENSIVASNALTFNKEFIIINW